MQHCQFCGSEFPDNARFCGNCGRTPASNVVFDAASSPEASMPTVASTPLPQGNQPVEEDEEERRRGAILPLPMPPWTEGSLTGGQVPQVHGTPSLSGVPTVQGTPPGNAGSATPSASPPGQPAAIEQHVLVRTDPQVVQHDGSTGLQQPSPLEQGPQGKPHHHRQHHRREPRAHHGRHAAGSASKAAIGATTKWILIAIIGLLVLAGAATAVVFASRSHLPGLGGTTPATSGKNTRSSSNRNASATACASSPGVLCSGIASPSSSVTSGHSTGTFSFAGAIPGPLIITSFPACGLQGSSYVMQVIGTIGGAQYKFLIGVLSYSGPGTYNSRLTVNLIRLPTPSLTELANDGRLPVSITITNGGKAGTVSSELEGILNGASQLFMGHVSGKWTCV